MKGETYEEFVDKFKSKLTTDDCYTPPAVYEAVAEWVSKEYDIDKNNFARPFYPGGDYENYDYSDKIVVDNPPFSIITEIVKFYVNHGIRFFMFSPNAVANAGLSDICTAICTDAKIEYENGAKVSTGFVTNLDDPEIRMRTAPELYSAINKANIKKQVNSKDKLPRYIYPPEVVNAAALGIYSRYGIDFAIPRNESVRIRKLDAQKAENKQIYGTGVLISERLAAEKLVAERRTVKKWELSEREKEIIKSLGKRL